jgi:hypothetical protein
MEIRGPFLVALPCHSLLNASNLQKRKKNTKMYLLIIGKHRIDTTNQESQGSATLWYYAIQ